MTTLGCTGPSCEYMLHVEDFDPANLLYYHRHPNNNHHPYLMHPADGFYETVDRMSGVIVLIPFYRCASRGLICFDCWKDYSEHPSDPNEECLTVLCNGWHVKL